MGGGRHTDNSRSPAPDIAVPRQALCYLSRSNRGLNNLLQKSHVKIRLYYLVRCSTIYTVQSATIIGTSLQVDKQLASYVLMYPVTNC